MKRLTILLFLPLFTSAQISIGKNNFPSSGDLFVYSVSATSGIDVSNTGANVSWDYTNLTSQTHDTVDFRSVTSTPLAYQLYFNNQFIYPDYKADYAIKGKDLNAFNQVNITEVYNFHKKENNAIQMVGFGANINGIPASIKYDTIDQLYPLPLSYGVSDSTSAYYLLDVPNMGTYGQWIKRKVEVDGWGSLTTPFQNYPEAIRVKTTLYQRDTLKTEQPVPLPGIAFDRPVQYKYEWFVLGTGVPVLSITEQAGQITDARYIDINTTGIEDNNIFNISLYPNPCSNTLYIESPYQNENITILTAEGKIVYQGPFSSTLNIEQFANGHYILILQNKAGNKAFKSFQKTN